MIDGEVLSRTPKSPAVGVWHHADWKQRIAARIIHTLISAVALTLRYHWARDPRELPQAGRPYIFCTWHNRLPLSLLMYRQYVRAAQGVARMAAIVSASRDGALLSRVLELFGVQPARGSSSRRGAQVLLELSTWAERGYDIAFAPDGPRGPRYQLKDGVITLAQMTGRPLVAASYHLSRKITLRNWDRFQIPLPFSTCTFHVSDPVPVPRELSDAQREQLRRGFQETLNSLTRD